MKLLNMLRNLASRPAPLFNPADLGDPIAMQTDWTPLKGGGTNFRDRKLYEADFNCLKFQPTIGAVIFYLIFFLVGMALIIVLSLYGLFDESFSSDSTIVPLLIGLVFAVLGGWMFYSGTVPIVFDRRKGYFWKGRKEPGGILDTKPPKWFAELRDIHALQIISEYCSGNKRSFYSYELNLVLENGNRINVVDHGNLDRLREDAATLAAFLGKPVWDALC